MLGYQPHTARSQWTKVKFKAIFIMLSAIVLFAHSIGYAQLQQDFPVTNASVTTILQDSSTLYIGGWFDYAGPNTGSGVVLDTATGKYNPSFPKITGTVYASVPDGKGGWYIGGRFSKIGSVHRNSLAHILSDGSVDSWNPSVVGQLSLSGPLEAAWVYSIVLVDSTLYIGGIFDHVGDTIRNMAAAVNTVTGLPTAWNPDPDNSVKAIIVTPSTIYLGGAFHYLQNNMPTKIYRSGLASVDPLTGVPSDWNPGAGISTGWSVNALQLAGSTLYVGGRFTTLGTTNRNGIGAVDAVTGLVTPWNPNAGGSFIQQIVVSALEISGNIIYIGGKFAKMGSQARGNLAAANLSGNGTVLPWNPNIFFVTKGTSSFPSGTASPGVYSLAASGANVYVGGFFNHAGSEVRRNLAAFDTSTGRVTAWDPKTSLAVFALKKSGANLYAGGEFTSVNGFTRYNLAAIDLETKTVNAWNPSVNEPVEALALYGSTIFVGGYFDSVGTQNTAILAAVDKKTGVVDPWTLNTVSAGGVGCLSIYKDKLYAGGWFYKMGDSIRSGIASIDLKSGKVLPWYPGEIRSPYGFAPTDSIIYTAGYFTSVGSDSQYSFAALNALTGKPESPWSPFLLSKHNALVAKIIPSNKMLYGCGKYGLSSPTDPALFKIDLTTKKVTTFGPAVSYFDMFQCVINNVAINGSTLYMIGTFDTVGGVSRSGIASIDLSTGAVKPWSPSINGTVSAVTIDSNRKSVYIGGGFSTINDEPASFLAAYTDVSIGEPTTINESPEQQPSSFILSQNYPNPFNPTTTISYSIPTNNYVTLKVFNILGQEVALLVNENLAAGKYTVTFNAGNLTSGVYLYRVEAGSFRSVKKMLLIK